MDISRRKALGYAGGMTAAALTASLVAGTGQAAAAAGNPARPPRSYRFDLLFDVPHDDNMQGLAARGDSYFVGFDVGGGDAVIREYDRRGMLLKESAALPLGHVAEISFRAADGLLHAVTGGGGNPTLVRTVDFDADEPAIVGTLDFSALGNAGLVAVDNARDQLLVHAGPSDEGPFTFAYADFEGRLGDTFELPGQGVPQGLEMWRDRILYYTNNKITLLDREGSITGTIDIPLSGESEGLGVLPTRTGAQLLVGYNAPNRVYRVRPDLH